MRLDRRWAFTAVAVATAIFAATEPAHALTCMPRSTQEQLAAADVVFVGKVTHHESNAGTEERAPRQSATRMAVLRVIKGKVGAVVSVQSARFSALAGDEDLLLVFARAGGDGQVELFGCSGTSKIEREDARLHDLGFRQEDFDALGLPSDAELMLRLAAEWVRYRFDVLACHDATCYQRLLGDDRNEVGVVNYYRQAFVRERRFYEWLPKIGGWRLLGGGVGTHSAYLTYRSLQPYRLSGELPYDGFVVTFRLLEGGGDRWQIQGARLSRLSEAGEVRPYHRLWTPKAN